MPLQAQVAAGGVPAVAAAAIVGNVATGLVATGTTNADALAIGAAHNDFVTVAASTGAILPASMGVGDVINVYNQGANALLVYPFATGQINALTATTGGFSVGAGKSAFFTRTGSIAIRTNLSA